MGADPAEERLSLSKLESETVVHGPILPATWALEGMNQPGQTTMKESKGFLDHSD